MDFIYQYVYLKLYNSSSKFFVSLILLDIKQKNDLYYYLFSTKSKCFKN